MMIAIILFIDQGIYQIIMITSIQLFEIIRLWNTWPFSTKKRNIIKLIL
jgi:hypothetical protein